LSQWLKNLVKKPNKKTNQKDLIKMVYSEMTCPKQQVGQGAKKSFGGVF
jgi:hypothetical protein